MQANLILLGKFNANLANETLKQMIDRFKKLIADVRAIDPIENTLFKKNTLKIP